MGYKEKVKFIEKIIRPRYRSESLSFCDRFGDFKENPHCERYLKNGELDCIYCRHLYLSKKKK